jgi:outer membrane protein OmpA-like peptidoglycan-associated protein
MLWLKFLKLSNSNFSIEGHTDSDGSNEYNQGLSDDRAAAVKALVKEVSMLAKLLQLDTEKLLQFLLTTPLLVKH